MHGADDDRHGEAASPWWSEQSTRNFVVATPGMSSDDEAAWSDHEEGMPARRLAESVFDALALGAAEETEEGSGEVAERPWSTARIRKRRGMTRAEMAEVESGVHQVARNECSMRELVDIHNRELMARIFDTVNKAPDRPPAVLGGEGLYECPRAGIAALAGWQLEHIRAFAVELSELAVVLKDVCTPSACPQMKATDEWMYLCAAHKQPQECCAIDYIVHTLDGTSALLNSNKWFPRTGVGVPETSTKYFQSISRRLYRILSHCYFHHTDIFAAVETQRHLCMRFVAFTEAFGLIPAKLLIIPRDAFVLPGASR